RKPCCNIENTEDAVSQILEERTADLVVFTKLFESGTFRSDQERAASRIDWPCRPVQNLKGELGVHGTSRIVRNDDVTELQLGDGQDVDVSPGHFIQIPDIEVQICSRESLELRRLRRGDTSQQAEVVIAAVVHRIGCGRPGECNRFALATGNR